MFIKILKNIIQVGKILFVFNDMFNDIRSDEKLRK